MSKEDKCPNCGRCPTCGHVPSTSIPIYPYQYKWYPWWGVTTPYTITVGTGAASSGDYTSTYAVANT